MVIVILKTKQMIENENMVQKLAYALNLIRLNGVRFEHYRLTLLLARLNRSRRRRGNVSYCTACGKNH